jgi:tRNA U55 pseudouridine synthase TruB
MRELRRTRTGPFREDSGLLVRMQELAEALYAWRSEGDDSMLRRVVVPGEYAVCHVPKVLVRDTAVDSLAHGAQLAAPGVAAVEEGFGRGDLVAILTLKGELVGLGRAEMSWEEMLQAERGIAVKPTRILIERGVYPRAWKRRKQQGEKR